jgi:hypothetical protein
MIDFGTLHLPTSEPAALAAAEWTDWPVHGWMLVACAAIILFSLPEINKILPAMAGCLARSRGNLEIEHSLSTARSRNTIARLLGLVFIVMADRYRLYDPSFIAPWSEAWLRLGELAGVAVAYLLFRRILHAVILGIGRKHMHLETQNAVRRGLYNYFICFVLLALPTICLLRIFNSSDSAARLVIWAELALLWIVAMVREFHILQSNFSGLLTFLYLCGLEFIPAAALIVSGLF